MSATMTFEYGSTRVRDISVQCKTDEKGRSHIETMTVDGKPYVTSKRFWTSFQTRFGLNPSVFRYFSHREVFDRISEKAPNDSLRFCAERAEGRGVDRLLAVSNPKSASIRHDQLMELLQKHGGEQMRYADGVVHSTHTPRVGAEKYNLAGDDFCNKFVLEVPIDGYGRPDVYLSLIRLICTNGAIGYTPAFRSEISVGKNDEDVAFALQRTLENFNNEEGFAALRQRFESASKSWASVNEVQKLYKILSRAATAGGLKRAGRDVIHHADGTAEQIETCLPIFKAYHDCTGDITQIYGLANLDTLSVKRQRTLPAACTVYDLLNFTTEVATHQANERGNRQLQSFVGDLISNEYDLEGTKDQFSDWRDFFIGSEATAETMQALSKRSR